MTTSHPTTRRNALRAGAWAAPAIVVAAAAPATAATGDRTLSLVRFGGAATGYRQVAYFQHDIYNTGPATTLDLRATLTVVLPDASDWGTAAPTTSVNGGWTLLSITGTGTTRTFSFDANTQLEPSATAFRVFDVTVNANGGNNRDLRTGTRSATAVDSPFSAAYGPQGFSAGFGARGTGTTPRVSLG